MAENADSVLLSEATDRQIADELRRRGHTTGATGVLRAHAERLYEALANVMEHDNEDWRSAARTALAAYAEEQNDGSVLAVGDRVRLDPHGEGTVIENRGRTVVVAFDDNPAPGVGWVVIAEQLSKQHTQEA